MDSAYLKRVEEWKAFKIIQYDKGKDTKKHSNIYNQMLSALCY